MKFTLGALLTVLAALTGCSAEEGPQTIELYAASSLANVFEELSASYEANNPGVRVRTNYAGSQVLRLQIEHGARPDVVASANPSHIRALEESGHVFAPRTFASNRLVVATPRESSIAGFEDLASAQRIVVGTPDVPVGAYTLEMLSAAERAAELGPRFVANVKSAVVSEETNVRIVRAKVELGVADAAIVYETDVVGSTRLRAVEIPPALNVRAEYLLARLSTSESEHSRRFVEFVLSPDGRAVIEKHGFGKVDL